VDRADESGLWFHPFRIYTLHTILSDLSRLDGALILTLDSWSSEHGCWGWEMAVGSTGEDTVLFHMTATIEQSAFYGTLSADKRQISGHYSGGQFASDQYTCLGK
jgi:hypothetical protein